MFARAPSRRASGDHRGAAEARLDAGRVARPVAVVRRVLVRVGTAAAAIAVDARAEHGVGVRDGDCDPQRVDAEGREVPAAYLLRHAGPVAAEVVRRRVLSGARAAHVAVVARVAVEKAVDEDEVDDGVAPVEDPRGRHGRRGARVVARAGDGAREVVRVSRVVHGRRLRGANHPRGAVDEELVLDGLVPRDVHRHGPHAPRVRHGASLRPRAGRVVAAQHDRLLAAVGVRERLGAELLGVGTLRRPRFDGERSHRRRASRSRRRRRARCRPGPGRTRKRRAGRRN